MTLAFAIGDAARLLAACACIGVCGLAVFGWLMGGPGRRG